MNKKICVVGGGKWGQNHIKTLYQLGNLGAIVEANAERLNELLKLYPVEGFTELEQALEQDFDGFTVAVPAPLHYEVAKKIIESGKSVLVEKPMTLSAETSKELVELAQRKGVQLMVGHVLLFHPAIRKIKEIIDSGELGNLYYLYSNRLNLGTVRTEENVFWSFAPHDISVLDYFVGHPAEKIVSKGSKFLQEEVYDVTITQLDYPNNVHAHIFVSWLHPFKEQRLVVIGSKGMVSFDDATAEKEIKFYDKRIDFEKGIPVKVENPTRIIPYEQKQPLSEELKYFIEHLDKKIEIADGQSGLEVVKVLEEAEKKIQVG
ncbi:MAG TPA: Gfo/Idh/MocA family oxidoreductase [Paludibacteraceae bacterium]|jgi:UDP-2-acetamido-3-amino-2,3-dideoxy-glucuronate N-acetyltransferase|nr:Gfo/Idh/MocA family oxidoreductase [Paludibacteraceae bacterium]OPZ03334.1 MAG: 4-carboxy-2-hydroxymuconate-6-semialdehyde dehydrogenase [Bacteroidetes bacterium ADurb.BinA395]MBP8965877.1 Gfo/Idh/MocA family oxidoreductase [Paludibacteraceae bacterium]HOF97778.1 Gfo/Idh/MocA family oxidoreductase [Paludibacteraceae bacterium]HOJ65738.1 Gfo/Idh/MocA family oxidoreductase [Paludibacteraceae bacterium]